MTQSLLKNGLNPKMKIAFTALKEKKKLIQVMIPKVRQRKTLYWSIQDVALPEDNKINPLTLVILSKASNFYVPVGDFIASESNHLVLPDVYVIDNGNQENILLQTLDIRRYFETINTEDKKIDDKKSESLIKNI